MNKQQRIEKSNKDLNEVKEIMGQWLDEQQDPFWDLHVIHIYNDLRDKGWRKIKPKDKSISSDKT